MNWGKEDYRLAQRRYRERVKQNDPEKWEAMKAVAAQRTRKWSAENKDHVKQRNAKHRTTERYKMNQSHRSRKHIHGITDEQYQMLLDRQNGVCAICGKLETVMAGGRVLSLTIDHDHATGAIRGLLCMRCNTGLGMFNDDEFLVERACDYMFHATTGLTSTASLKKKGINAYVKP